MEGIFKKFYGLFKCLFRFVIVASKQSAHSSECVAVVNDITIVMNLWLSSLMLIPEDFT